jgi:hypothetical protein
MFWFAWGSCWDILEFFRNNKNKFSDSSSNEITKINKKSSTVGLSLSMVEENSMTVIPSLI